MTDPAVTNSACLIGLERIKRLDLLYAMYRPLYVPTAVEREVGRTDPEWTVRTVSVNPLATSLKLQMGAGEAEAIALSVEIGGLTVILDDRTARKVAERLSLPVIGTVGVVLRSKAKGITSEVRPIMDALLDADFRIHPDLYARALKLAGE